VGVLAFSDFNFEEWWVSWLFWLFYFLAFLLARRFILYVLMSGGVFD